MKFYIIIPAHNEEKHIRKTLQSLAGQTLLPAKIVVVDDNSTDATSEITEDFRKKHTFISLVKTSSSKEHLPGSKVIRAFYKGLETLDNDYDIICKFDADLIFPENYLETIASIFNENPKCGMAGGFCYIEKNGKWVLENLTDKEHIRGALKAYSKNCFQAIGKLKPEMGWDTVDELLAKYNGFEVITNQSLQVKHLKPTGKTYDKSARYQQGRAFYTLRYGFWITLIASLKLAFLKKRPLLVFDYLKGYIKAKRQKAPYLVNEDEGRFIRKFRRKKMREKLF